MPKIYPALDIQRNTVWYDCNIHGCDQVYFGIIYYNKITLRKKIKIAKHNFILKI